MYSPEDARWQLSIVIRLFPYRQTGFAVLWNPHKPPIGEFLHEYIGKYPPLFLHQVFKQAQGVRLTK